MISRGVLSCILLASSFMTVGNVFAQATGGGAAAGGDWDGATSLKDLYVFGKGLSPQNYGGYGKADELFRDPYLGDLSTTPKELRTFSNEASSTSAVASGGTTSSGVLGNPSAAPAGVTSGSETAEAITASDNFRFNPRNPRDSLKGILKDEKVSSTVLSSYEITNGLYAATAADPNFGNALTFSALIGTGLASTTHLASMEMNDQFARSGTAGLIRMENTAACEDAIRESGNPNVYAHLECIPSVSEAGTNGRSARGGSPFVARLGAPQLPETSGGGGAPVTQDQALIACGMSKDLATGTSEVSCDQKVLDQVRASSAGATVHGGLSLSQRLFPGATGPNAEKRTAMKKAFGDVCYVCMVGGRDPNTGKFLNLSTGTVVKYEVPPTEKLITRFEGIEKSVYENLRRVLHNKCLADNLDPSTGQYTRDTASEIFNLKANSSDGETKDTWENGSFWRGGMAYGTGTGASAKLRGQINVYEALDFMSFNGFRLTAPVIDVLYSLVDQKGDIAAVSTSGGGALSNPECDKRLKEGTISYAKVRERLKTNSVAGPLPREIKSLYFLAQRLALGKVYDGCESALMVIARSAGRDAEKRDAQEIIVRVCSGDNSDPSAFGNKRSGNLESLNSFVNLLFQQKSVSSGKSGSSVAKAFQGDKVQAASGDIQ